MRTAEKGGRAGETINKSRIQQNGSIMSRARARREYAPATCSASKSTRRHTRLWAGAQKHAGVQSTHLHPFQCSPAVTEVPIAVPLECLAIYGAPCSVQPPGAPLASHLLTLQAVSLHWA